MPLTIENLAAELDRVIVRNINSKIMDKCQELLVPVNDHFKLIRVSPTTLSSSRHGPHGTHKTDLFTVTFDTAPLPTRRHLEQDDGVNIKRATLQFNGDRTLLSPHSRNKFHFVLHGIGTVDMTRKLAAKIVEINQAYNLGGAKTIAAKVEEEKAKKAMDSAEAQIDERRKKQKATEIQRESMYEELTKSLKGFGTVESEVKSGYMNLRLDNNVRVKIAVDDKRAFITEIETPMYFDRGGLDKILNYLQKVASL